MFKYIAVFGILILFLMLCFVSCQAQNAEENIQNQQKKQQVPHNPKYDFRGVWLTTVHHIDWPSRRKMSVDEQKKELLLLFDTFQKAKLNAVFGQIRPSGDAFYPSELEFWSEIVSGKQGKPPTPYYDPTAMMVEEAHNRNMEFHAWFNPYRAVTNLSWSDVHPQHLTKLHPEWFFDYGGRRFFNPGVPEVRQHIVAVITDVIKRYDVDGVHFDDYFYPYKINGETLKDDETYQKYGKVFGSKEEWRRNNIDMLVKSVHDSLQKYKPHIKFGVSPVGAWRNKDIDVRGSNTRVGQPAYDYLYADTRKWLELGWVDYMAPQFYWSTKSKYGHYETLVNWWHDNAHGRHIYSGQSTIKLGDNADDLTWTNPNEFGSQMQINRKYEQVKGSIFYSGRSFLKNPMRFVDTLNNNYYKYPSLIPAMAWKDSIPPNQPDSLRVKLMEDGAFLEWNAPQPALDNEKATYYVIYRFDNYQNGNQNGNPNESDKENLNLQNHKNIIATTRQTTFKDKNIELSQKYFYVVRAVDRQHNESKNATSLLFISDKKLYLGKP